ncbi:hypothetical protein TNCV_3729571 [Trichonephila clavipes]|nr:hypothetical protein TNCV_3729571 [Trichonephila clavipes]
MLHQNNESAPIARSIKQFVTSKNITLIGHPPYSPDLVHCDFFFPTVKTCLKEPHFTSVEEVQEKTENPLKGLLKPRSGTVTSNGSTECRSW